MWEVTKIFKDIAIAHKLVNYEGPCSRIHGHSLVLEVTVCGEKLENNMLIDFSKLKTIVQEEVIAWMDHEYLNDFVNFNPTAEMLAQHIFIALSEALADSGYYSKLKLKEVVVWESSTSKAKYSE